MENLRYLRAPKLLDLTTVGYSLFEVRPALAPAKMLSLGRMAFAVLSVTCFEISLMIFMY